MLSHQIGAGLRADLAALAKARKELARVRKDSETEARQQARRMRAKLSEIGQLRERVAQLEGIEQAHEAMRERLRALEDDPERRVLRARVRALEQDNERQGRQLADAVSHNAYSRTKRYCCGGCRHGKRARKRLAQNNASGYHIDSSKLRS